MAELEKFRSDFGFMAKSFREMSIHVVFYLDEMIAQIKFKRQFRCNDFYRDHKELNLE
jgi:hypothetical protein